jgi:hypothetical protein
MFQQGKNALYVGIRLGRIQTVSLAAADTLQQQNLLIIVSCSNVIYLFLNKPVINFPQN